MAEPVLCQCCDCQNFIPDTIGWGIRFFGELAASQIDTAINTRRNHEHNI